MWLHRRTTGLTLSASQERKEWEISAFYWRSMRFGGRFFGPHSGVPTIRSRAFLLILHLLLLLQVRCNVSHQLFNFPYMSIVLARLRCNLAHFNTSPRSPTSTLSCTMFILHSLHPALYLRGPSLTGRRA